MVLHDVDCVTVLVVTVLAREGNEGSRGAYDARTYATRKG
jgi:hypothetical protein